MIWLVPCTPVSVRPAQTTDTGSLATLDRAASTAACTLGLCRCRCQPQKALPSYSTAAAMRFTPAGRTSPQPNARENLSLGLVPESLLSGKCLEYVIGFFALLFGAILKHLFKQITRIVRVAHIHIGFRKNQLGIRLIIVTQ